MREYKFKAWDITHKKWYSRVHVGTNCGHAVYDEEREMWLEFDEFCGEVVQWTGLNDSKGNPIYEGDVVTARERSDRATFTGRVHFLNGIYWVDHIGYESYYVKLIQLVNAEYKPIEILGNQFENPELINS